MRRCFRVLMAATNDVTDRMGEITLTYPPDPFSESNPQLKQQCSQLGRNRFFEARPSVVHFSGFEVGSVPALSLAQTSILFPSFVVRLVARSHSRAQ